MPDPLAFCLGAKIEAAPNGGKSIAALRAALRGLAAQFTRETRAAGLGRRGGYDRKINAGAMIFDPERDDREVGTRQ